MTSSDRLHGGNVRALLGSRALPVSQVLDFSVDLNPFGPPPGFLETLRDQLEAILRYPDPDATALREAIAADQRIPADSILPANGSAALVPLLTRLRPVRRAVVVVPTFTEYEWTLEQIGAQIRRKATEERRRFELDVDDPEWSSLLQHCDLVVLSNPNNPTGTALSRQSIRWFGERCKAAGALLVVDEGFIDLTERPEDLTVIDQAAGSEHMVVLRSMTKLYAIPGLRLGYLVAAPEAVRRLRAWQSAWPLNALALTAGVQLLRETTFVEESRRGIAAAREDLRAGLQRLSGIRPYPSTTNFMLCRLGGAVDSGTVCARLAAQGVLVRNGDSFTGLERGRHVRIAVRTHAEHERLIDALRAALQPAEPHGR